MCRPIPDQAPLLVCTHISTVLQGEFDKERAGSGWDSNPGPLDY
jgi:hypothetical protein